MKALAITAMPALFGILLSSAGGIKPPAQDSSAAWRTDWQQARIEAKQAGKPLFVVFR